MQGTRAPGDTGRRSSIIVWVLGLVLAVVWFGGLGHRKLIKPDEGRYAEIPREMVATGDWLTPRLNGLKYFEKPPLQYWTTAAAYEAFGPSEWTSRLWTALTGFCGILVVGFTSTRLHGRRAGLFAAAVLASELAYVLLAHFNTLDMGLTFFMTTTLCAVLLARDATGGQALPDAHCAPRDRRSRSSAASASKRWMLVAWVALALAVLSKGPVAVVLCGGALVAYLAVSRDWGLLRSLWLMRGLAVFVLVAGPWFVAVSKANPDFAHFFFIHEHVERFLTTEHRREGPWWYFVPVVVVGSLPWLTLVPRALLEGWRASSQGRFSPTRLLVVYAAVVFAFFSVSGSKLPSYVLPVFPVLAMLAGRTLASIGAVSLRRHLVASAMIAVATAVAFGLVPLDSREPAASIGRFRVDAIACMAVWLAGTCVAIVLASRQRVRASILAACAASVVGWAGLLLSHETLGRGMSSYDLARAMEPAIEPDTTIYSVGLFEHTLDFYLRRTVTLVAFRDELDFGLSQEPARGIPTLGEFIVRWNAERAPLAVMAPDVFDTLEHARMPMRIVAEDGRRIVVGKPPSP